MGKGILVALPFLCTIFQSNGHHKDILYCKVWCCIDLSCVVLFRIVLSFGVVSFDDVYSAVLNTRIYYDKQKGNKDYEKQC